VFDRKYAVSGAQDTKVFFETIQKSFSEWQTANPEVQLQVAEGHSCKPDGECQ
jgi:predicted DsbA family dithiol-disulfide isomerase